MRMVALSVILMSVAACQPAADAPVDAGAASDVVAPEPAPAPEPVVIGGVDLSMPVRVSGTEPFWGVDITPGTLAFSGVDRAELLLPNPGAAMQGEAAVIAAEGLTITLRPSTCSDGMSDRVYRLEAEVMLGAERLKGCAETQAALDAMPKP